MTLKRVVSLILITTLLLLCVLCIEGEAKLENWQIAAMCENECLSCGRNSFDCGVLKGYLATRMDYLQKAHNSGNKNAANSLVLEIFLIMSKQCPNVKRRIFNR